MEIENARYKQIRSLLGEKGNIKLIEDDCSKRYDSAHYILANEIGKYYKLKLRQIERKSMKNLPDVILSPEDKKNPDGG